ncbi:aminopeptidase [Bdellovibrio bacteriovorus]|uniref:Aminopeptidase n=1 Tax=Bdellovibrio bacteriovorus TaxID=959 RepID=A0A150WID9_BDEBC|nr:aminopeptidase [Bdellovibrio bacteriovorus]KYG63433.1 aminopeptidase [Bdellovibrio bacteriovorus]
MGYLMKSGMGQMQLLSSRVPLEEALKDPKLEDSKKQKLRLAQEARVFAEQELHLTATKNYTSYVELGRPYVTYVVSAAPRWELKHYQWSYPFMGKMPYKGFFNEADAQELEKEMQKEDLDTYMRGVSAYSTLGWFNDPILSSMLRYDDYTLVNTIIHETVHATLYIKNSADFNERLATFLGNKGAEQFYLKREGPNSPTLKEIQKESSDSKTFSKFISAELKDLENWYKNLPSNKRDEAQRLRRIHEIQDKFVKEIQPQMLTDNYAKFPELKLNNARLLVYKTYMQDLSEFEKLYELVGSNYSRFIETCKSLEKSKDPNQGLKDLIQNLSAAK